MKGQETHTVERMVKNPPNKNLTFFKSGSRINPETMYEVSRLAELMNTSYLTSDESEYFGLTTKDLPSFPEIKEDSVPFYWPTSRGEAIYSLSDGKQLFVRPVDFDEEKIKSLPEYKLARRTTQLRLLLVLADHTVLEKVLAMSVNLPADQFEVQLQRSVECYQKKRDELLHDAEFKEFVRTDGDSVVAKMKQDYKASAGKTKNIEKAFLYGEILSKLDGAYEDLKVCFARAAKPR